MQEIRKQFPVLNHNIYANTAAFGLLNEELLEWRQEHDLDYLIGGGTMKMDSLGIISETKQVVGDFFGCSRERVALVPNFSLGLNTLAEGMDKKEKVLLLENDYPSVNWPFESRDFQISYAKIDENLEENIKSKIQEDGITVLALSLVQWLNGIKINTEFLKALKAEFPNLLIVADGTQFCGTAAFDFDSSDIDILGTSAYKWLLAGSGNGFLLFREGVEARFSLKTIGFNSTGANLDSGKTFRFSKHFEPGHLDSLSFGSLKFSLEMLSRIGMEAIEDQNRRLAEKARKEFTTLGLLEDAVLKRDGHSTIFNVKGNDGIFDYLTANEVVCSQRGGGIRLSFHFYNTMSDIDRIVEILRSAD